MVDSSSFSWILPLAEEAYANREEILSNWEKFKTQLTGKQISIAVTGLPGVGKSVLCDYLSEKAYQRNYSTPGKSEDLENNNIAAKNIKIRLSTIPGQDSPNKLAALDEIFHEEYPIDGVIHVVANGYSSLRSAFAQEWYQGTDIEAYRQAQLKVEIDDISDICERMRKSIRITGKPKWLLVAVTKIDLYYDTIEQARDRYHVGESEFTRRIRKLSNQVGSDNFTWEVLPVCSILDDFKLGDTIYQSKFKEKERNHYINQFLKKIIAISKAS
ncbi:GTPase [Crocosphaera sp. XPORK-15E]|uniref:GTPase n=1 Tax=Crocosphaera sp. XPORK-15E TaxID=3110247 RepID=UPI002B2109F5|nr:GTPase [Crocosphaera sp. XPORK-15E]MEA5535393.1 GTPase [Crocosphaera sp. XPORK-15E]